MRRILQVQGVWWIIPVSLAAIGVLKVTPLLTTFSQVPKEIHFGRTALAPSVEISISIDTLTMPLEDQPRPMNVMEKETYHLSSHPTSNATIENESRMGMKYEFIVPKQNASTDGPPRLWIYVSSWSEGMANWMKAMAEILIVARSLNATVVEPCMFHGYLQSCEFTSTDSVNKTPTGVKFGHIFDLDLIKQFHPHFESYERFKEETAQPHVPVFRMCMQIGSPPAKLVCQGANLFSSQQTSPELDNAMKSTLETVTILEVISMRKKSFAAMQYHGAYLVDEPVNTIVANFFRFTRQQHEYAQKLLEKMRVNSNSYSVIQWRAEKPKIDFLRCAEAILKAKKSMTSPTKDPRHQFVLISSLNSREDLMWGDAKRSIQRWKSNSSLALKMLQEAGFAKLDSVIDESEIPDSGMLAVWDLIIAANASTFATCTFPGCRRNYCVKCNWLGSFVHLAVSMRDTMNKSSHRCWPQS